MGKISTSELFDRYFESVKGTSIATNRKQIDNAQLYAYEMQIGKELIDMDVDDLFGLIIELRNKRKGKEINFMISHASYDQLSTILRALFNFYIDNIEVIRNPLNDKRMKGKEATKRLSQGREAFRWSIVEDIIKNVHKDYDVDKADYIELILLLFYNGFSKASEIVYLKEDMIDFRNQTIMLPGRTIKPSVRCYNLLMKFNQLDKIEGWRGDYLLRGWRGGFFKFIIRPSQEYNIDERPESSMSDIINRCIANNINDKYGTKINYHILFMLGFYEFLVSKFGEEKSNRIISSYRDSEDVILLMDSAREYGIKVDNVSHLKRYLRPFIQAE